MNRFLNIATISSIIWFGTAFLAWVKVTDPHSESVVTLGTLIGQELSTLSLLIPGIVFLMTLIARYQKLAKVLIPAAALIATAGIWFVYTSDWLSSSAVLELIAAQTGQASVTSFVLQNQSGVMIFVVIGAITVSLLTAATIQKPQKITARDSEVSGDSPTQELWDLQ
ncbi:MAG: hypothetical protein WBH43_00160 [Aquiluna sp.]